MSNQTSTHFDPTSLLIIKTEVDNSLQLVESAVNSLFEDRTLPFGIDDALLHLQQCCKVLNLIDMPQLAKLADYSSELMQKIMQNPEDIRTSDVIALTEGTTMLKRYIEFTCLREVNVTEFLFDTTNTIELALGKPVTHEGHALLSSLETSLATLNVEAVDSITASQYVQKLYKISLDKFLSQTESDANFDAFKQVGHHLAQLSIDTPSQKYWHLVYHALQLVPSEAYAQSRFRTLIQLETNIDAFLANPAQFEPTLEAYANVTHMCLCQESDTASRIRQHLNIEREVYTHSELQNLSRHLYGPDLETIQVVSKLVIEQLIEVRNDIEFNYQDMSEEKVENNKTKLIDLAHVFQVLNLDEPYLALKNQAENLNSDSIRSNQEYVQQLMNTILNAMNAIGILERNHTSDRLQMHINNPQISLDRLDNAYDVLLMETKALVDLSSQTLVQYISEPETTDLEAIPSILKEISGAMLFLNNKSGNEALLNCSIFMENEIPKDKKFNIAQIQRTLDVLASVDLLIENIQSKQPILQKMFHIALQSSQNLKAVV